MNMRNFLDMIFDYQLLRAKQDNLEVPLDDIERARLLGLAQLLAGEGSHGKRAMPRLPMPAKVSFTTPGGFASGDVKNVSGKGLAIATSRPPAVGTRLIVRMVDVASGCEFFFPCRVIWCRKGSPPGMGVAFDGVPTRSDYVEDGDTGVWKRSFTIGGQPRVVSAA